jgi:hypothetical protein
MDIIYRPVNVEKLVVVFEDTMDKIRKEKDFET